jgi:uncharacterized metal-binding protein YceD (DUF177 family)
MKPTLKKLRFEVLRLKTGAQTYEQEDSPAIYDLQNDPEYTFDEPVRIALTLRLIGSTVIMTGTVSTVATAPCARCLESIRIPLNAKVSLAFMTDERLLDRERYPELIDDGSLWYDGEAIYPAEELRELLLLELPQIPACELEPGDICPVRNVKITPRVFGPAEEFEEEKAAAEEGSLSAQLRKLRKDIE